MQRSTDRFLTTHTGSLPRPDDLIRTMYAKEEGVPVDPAALAARVRAAVAEVVKKQAAAGVDLINDGEMSKPSYATYIKDRLDGFGGTGNTFVYQDLAEFPEAGKARVRRSRPLAPQDAGLQRADQRARRAGGRHRCRQSESGAGAREGRRRLHERGLARRGVAVLPQRALPEPGGLSGGDRRGHAARIRDRRQGRLRAADRLSGPRHGPAYSICRFEPGGIPQARAACMSRRSTTRWPISRPSSCACMCAGAITRARIIATCRSPTSSTSCSWRGRTRFRSRPPIRATPMNGRCSSA